MHIINPYRFSAGTDLKSGLVSYWGLDETSGITCYDSHGSHDGTIVDATINQTGIIDKAYYFPNYHPSAEYVEFDTFASEIFDGTHSQMSVSFWYKTPSTLSQAYILGKYDFYLGTPGRPRSLYLTVLATGALRIFAGSGTSNYEYYTTSSTPCNNTSTWYHIVMTVDLSTDTCKFYVNNSTAYSVGKTSYGNVDYFDDNDSINLHIGRVRNSNDTYSGIEGTVDMVGIWIDKILTTSQISELYNSGNGLQYSNWT